MAITDHGALYGAVAFYQAARSKGTGQSLRPRAAELRRLQYQKGVALPIGAPDPAP